MLTEYVMLYIKIPPSLKASQSLIPLGATMLPPRSKVVPYHFTLLTSISQDAADDHPGLADCHSNW